MAVHFRRMKAILETEEQAAPVVRFGSAMFHDDLAAAVRSCGLTWNEAEAVRAFDRSCVHHEPATVYHDAQAVYQELGASRLPQSEVDRVGWLQARDAQRCDAMTHSLAQGDRGDSAIRASR